MRWSSVCSAVLQAGPLVLPAAWVQQWCKPEALAPWFVGGSSGLHIEEPL